MLRIAIACDAEPERGALEQALRDATCELALGSLADLRARLPDGDPIDVALIDAGDALDAALALSREVRAGRDGSSGTKVVLTARTDALSEAQREDALDAVDAIILRPFAREELVSVVRSLARLRQTELTLIERAQRLVELHRRKDEFLAMLGHELRNPLAGITGAVVLLRAAPPGEIARSTRAVGVIERQSSALRRIVDDLLDVARVTRGGFELHREPLEVTELARHALTDLELQTHRIAQRQLVLVPPREPVWVDGDPARLLQVISNLLDNALKHTRSDGRVELAIAAREGEVEIRVSDDGAGIPAEGLARLFEPFYQVSPSLDRRAGGLGLGLALVRRIAQLHGGSVGAHSEGRDRGSTFTLRLPTRASPRAPSPATLAGATAPLRILYVEDEPDIAWPLKAQMEAWGHVVSYAADGGAAIEIAQRERGAIELALIDIGLPVRDGYDVARAVLSVSPTTSLVALTGYGTVEHGRRIAQAGFTKHLLKPIDLATLERLLRELPRRVLEETA